VLSAGRRESEREREREKEGSNERKFLSPSIATMNPNPNPLPNGRSIPNPAGYQVSESEYSERSHHPLPAPPPRHFREWDRRMHISSSHYSVTSGFTKVSLDNSCWEDMTPEDLKELEKRTGASTAAASANGNTKRWSFNSMYRMFGRTPRMESTVSVNITRALTPGTLAECVDGSGAALYEAVFSIGGMTCASCSNRITEAVESLRWVQSVRVDLLSNSATVVFDGMGCGGAEVGAEAILQQVEDTGYDCTLEELDVAGSRKQKPERGTVGAERTVSLKVDGMSCTGCAEKVAEVVGFSFPDHVLEVESPPITLTSPVIHVRYKPQPPEFTVRHIASVISSISPDFVVSVYHPPTIEDRSRQLQQVEQWRILLRLIFCLAIAIPTFLIGIVWMTFMPENDPVRKALSKPMWAGRSTRMEWALFFLATPVMFLIADVFHKRAIRDIRALWRKGSPTPVLRRFYRFGSMNLLISLGVSISYFASLVLLGINAASKPVARPNYGLQERRMNTYTYFDSTVFLTMFLLIGTFFSYSHCS